MKPENRIPLLNIADVATFCCVSEKTVRRWIARHEPAPVRLGAQWRIRPQDLDLFVRERLEL